MKTKYALAPFKIHPNAQVNEGIFTRLDHAIYSSLSTPSIDPHYKKFLLWCYNNFDPDEYAEVQNSHAKLGSRSCKFLSFSHYMDSKWEHFQRLGLHLKRPKKILDVGCGPGHFQLLSSFFNHDAIGLDLFFEDPHVFNCLIKFFGQTRYDHKITSKNFWPDSIDRFDLITVLLCQFDVLEGIYWAEETWARFLKETFQHHITSTGIMYISLTSDPNRPKGIFDYLRKVSVFIPDNRTYVITQHSLSAET